MHDRWQLGVVSLEAHERDSPRSGRGSDLIERRPPSGIEVPKEHVAGCRLTGAERVPIAPRIAERGQVPVLDAGDGECLAQPPLREARLARDRVLPHVEDDFDAVIHQLGD